VYACDPNHVDLLRIDGHVVIGFVVLAGNSSISSTSNATSEGIEVDQRMREEYESVDCRKTQVDPDQSLSLNQGCGLVMKQLFWGSMEAPKSTGL